MDNRKSIHSPEYSELIRWLTQERKRLCLSQAEVARSLGMSQSDISKIENQERRIDVLEFKHLIVIYRINDNLKLKRYIQSYFGIGNET